MANEKVRRMLRGVAVLAIALCGALLMDAWQNGPSFANHAYTQQWLGNLFRILSGAYVGYWLDREFNVVDPSTLDMSWRLERLKSRAILMAACIIGACAL
jgi:hypothetical protein